VSDSGAGHVLFADRITKRFVDRSGDVVCALEDVTIGVRPHQFVSVIGPSGCGKSTFLRIVAGLDRPTEGRITVTGKPVQGPGADRGMVFQEYALLPWKTTLQNVAFGLQLKGITRAEREAKARTYVELVGLTGFEDKYPHQLSGGMRQRAAVARALANQPAVLLMDEPFAALDAITRARLQEELAAIVERERTTVLFVTHSIEEAVFLSDRVVLLSGRPGRVSGEYDVILPRPRRWDALTRDRAFVALREELLGSFHDPEKAGAGGTAHV
jgi:NitT/TauT family transport system ATP-binding protein